MLKLTGHLTIRTIDGRNGPFNVGRLLTEIGEFAVKEALLDQYEPGRYEGDFGISRIYPSYYQAGGRLVVEVRAMLETLALAAIDALAPEDQVLETEPDPLEERVVAQVDTVPTQAPESPPEVAPGSDADAALFGEIWPLGEKVKLDPTVNRGVFRQQRDRLKALGYTFQPLGQVWTFATGERGA